MMVPCDSCIHEAVCWNKPAMQRVNECINEVFETAEIRLGDKDCTPKDLSFLNLKDTMLVCKNYRMESAYKMAAQMAQYDAATCCHRT